MNFWGLLQNLGIYALMVAGLTFLAKTVVLQYFSKDLERFKSELAMAAYEHQIRFSRLHEKRAKVIEETYSNLVNLYFLSSLFLRMFPFSKKELDDQNVSDLLEAMGNFVTHFERHRVYFNSEVSEKIVRLKEGLSRAFSMPLGFSTKQILTADRQVEMKEWGRAMDMMQKEIPPIKADLEDTFRELLGVIQPKKEH